MRTDTVLRSHADKVGLSAFGDVLGTKSFDQSKELQGKESADSKGLGKLSEKIVPHILNIYGSCATACDFEIYAPNAIFEDPLSCAQGVKQIKSAFYSLSKVFSESAIVEYSIQENAATERNGEILMDNKQHYKFMGKNVEVISLIKLRIKDGKVVCHEDWWNKKPLWNRETVGFPLVGRLAEMMRKSAMLGIHVMMGFGKDP
ncbi:hypothetical protein AMTR_s00030p00217190 [Amborella trichopoda]|uniref:SnoaL-like domain-containing protein n=1 Tax=Amborella trichopoda TaxID=13333 RepID=U5D1P2_AMBTC|nr:hypothetical protein AMTR_s00030p00217190 [Amborella trichopoda]